MRALRLVLLTPVLAACGAPHVAEVRSVAPPAAIRYDAPPTIPDVSTTTTEAPTTTTTEEPPAAPAPKPPTRAVSSFTGTGERYGLPCGGSLPPCWVLEREGSRGDPNAVNPTGCSGRGCYGIWQFDPRTRDVRGMTVDEQNDVAREVWADGAGCAHWGACASR